MKKTLLRLLHAALLALAGLPAAHALPVPSCTPYGPKAGYQYDPAMLMSLLGQPRTLPGPFLSAHRGAWGADPALPAKVPENSLEAIDNAAKLGFEMVELDVKIAQDGKLVLMHDYTAGRSTDYSLSTTNGTVDWDAFNAMTSTGLQPQSTGDWTGLDAYDPLMIHLGSNANGAYHLRLFDKYSSAVLGTRNGATATGQWVRGSWAMPTLPDTLAYIGQAYPGMTVVLDLRHLDEVLEAMKEVATVHDCLGNPASSWVILKPFANVFKGGWFNANAPGSRSPDPQSAFALTNQANLGFKWIPVIANRLVPPTPMGQRSIIPTSPGPDPSQIMGNVIQYVQDWMPGINSNVVTVEIGVTSNSVPAIGSAYTWASQYVTNMQSWRPPDINVAAPAVDPATGKTVVGFNWKDDGIGAYPVTQDYATAYQTVRQTAGAITVDDAMYVLAQEAATRTQVQLSIARPVVSGPQADVAYELINPASGKVLSVASSGTADLTPIVMNADAHAPGQIWRLLPNGPDSARLVNPNSLKSLDVYLGAKTPGTIVEIYPNNTSTAQQWSFIGNSDGTYTVASSSGMVLTIASSFANNGIADGDPVQIADETYAPNQKWVLRPVADIEPGQVYELKNPASGKFLDVVAGGTADLTNVQIFHEMDGVSQRWRIFRNADGTYQLLNPNSGKALDVYLGGTAEDTNVEIYTPNASVAQKWTLLSNGDGTFTFANPNANKVLTVAPGTADQTNVQIDSDSGADSQKWVPIRLPRVYRFTSVYWNGLIPGQALLDAYAGGTADYTKVDVALATPLNGAQSWYISDDDGTYKLVNPQSTKVLDVLNGSAQAGTTVQLYHEDYTGAQQWRFLSDGLGNYWIYNALNLSLLDLSAPDYKYVVISPYSGSAGQKWDLVSVP